MSNPQANIGSKGVLPLKRDAKGKMGLPVPVEKLKETQFKPQRFITNKEMVKRRADGLCLLL